jgi:hypothetical protein
MDANDSSSPEPSCENACCQPKCCRAWLVLCIVLLGCALLAAFLPRLGHNKIASPPLLKADGKDLKSTLITPHLEAPITPGNNVLWCSTFQLVWNESCRYAGGDIHLTDETPMVAALNKKTADEKDVDAASCLVISGLVEKGIVAKIRRELERKFEGQADPDLLNSIEADLPSQGWLAYAYLFRELPFKRAFKRLPESLDFGSVSVASFGVRNVTCYSDDSERAEQVDILDYRDADDFIVALKPEAKSERILLAKIAPAETLQKTIEAVRSRIASSKDERRGESLEMGESIVVPVLNFDLLRVYDELYGKAVITSGPLNGMPIVLAMQSIRFRLDENGAVLKSEDVVAYKCAESPKPRRQLIFDKPFLILLERLDAAHPYFALWVDNPELLTPFK